MGLDCTASGVELVEQLRDLYSQYQSHLNDDQKQQEISEKIKELELELQELSNHKRRN